MNTTGSSHSAPQELYTEKQWVPWYWWLAGIGIAFLTAGQIGHNRDAIWFWATLIFVGGIALWALWQWSSTTISVVRDGDDVIWLHAGDAQLPMTVVSRTLAVPASAKRNAMGRQLDPAAFVVSRSWIPEMAMFVIDDPEDPTPYWLVSTTNPEKLLSALHGVKS